MLVLSRKVGDELVIDDQIRIEVLSICCGKVSIGITAPVEIPVVRAEIQDRYPAGLMLRRVRGGMAKA